jgi:PleD family two-component response regulator
VRSGSEQAQGGMSLRKEDRQMIGYEQVEILLVEDSETDAEMTMRALGRKNLANNLVACNNHL